MPLILKTIFVHNLKGINVTIPEGCLVVFTGVSGSGKSSLLFDTIYAEGQRRYLEALSPHLRNTLGELPKPNIESATGLAPTIALEQRFSSRSPRSTVGTMTGIYDFLRVLFARIATPYCPVSGEPVAPLSRAQIIDQIKTLPLGMKMLFLSPYAQSKKGAFQEDFSELLRRGFTRVRVDGSFLELGSIEPLDPSHTHDIDLVVDRVVHDQHANARINEATLNALDLGKGFFTLYDLDSGQELFFSEHAHSKKSGLSYPPLQPHNFSFNHPDGMCSACHGLGCTSCNGDRIKPYPAAARLGNKRIGDLTRMPIEELLAFFNALVLPLQEARIADELLREIKERLSFLIRVGVSYLSLARAAPTLSGGEAQRVRLAAHIGSGLVGALYILDEPSVGLHPHDHERLLETLFHLRDLGNSVLIAEHDLASMRAADWLIDIGPGAGPNGGRLVAQGSVDDIMRTRESITGGYLSGRLTIALPQQRRPPGEHRITIVGAHHHNLKNITVSIPLSGLTCITGISGSGKSSLITELLVPALQNLLHKKELPVGKHKALKGTAPLHKIIAVDQQPIGRSSLSSAATYCKLFQGIDFPYKGKMRDDFLAMSVDEALAFFGSHKKLEILQRVGLGYLILGQNATTLSGGESQRIKLSRELARPSTRKKTLYVLDEPTTGLHLHDLKQLLTLLNALIEKGNAVLIIEHNMELVKTADWVIDLHEGAIAGEGTPEQIATCNTPTGKALRATLNPSKSSQKKSRPQNIPRVSALTVKSARQNNLKGVSLSIPHGSITAFTGPSGSGKSSLAFDTLFAEGQRRFAETLPSYSRSFLPELPKPNVEEIAGLRPTFAVRPQHNALNPRSTVATLTNLSASLHALYAAFGTAYDPETGEEILRLTKESAVDRILTLPEGEKIQILFPLEKPRNFDQLLEQLNREGFVRIRLNGSYYPIDAPIPKQRIQELLLVVDRLVIHAHARERLLTAIEKAPKGAFVVVHNGGDLYFNLAFSLSPSLFSPNTEEGMCPNCQGLGVVHGAHLEESEASSLELFHLLVRKKGNPFALSLFTKLFAHNNVDPSAPLCSLSVDARRFVLEGSADAILHENLSYRWIGFHTVLERLTHSRHLHTAIRPLLRAHTCDACRGERLSPLARHVRLAGVTLPELYTRSIRELIPFFESLPPTEHQKAVLKQLHLLTALGLDYLSLERTAPSLSSGELQRLRLAVPLNNDLTSCLLILDEPTHGLHPSDSERLLPLLKKQRDQGNTLLIIEHDSTILRAVDHIVAFGPGSGNNGGNIVAQGPPCDILAGEGALPVPKKRRPHSPDLRIEHASLHNLKDITVSFPKGAISCLTGVSGAGKSSLLQVVKERCTDSFERVISVSAAPTGGSSARSDIASYCGVLNALRTFFASLASAQAKGLQSSHFSPNTQQGMCRTCSGLGYRTVDLQFLPDVHLPCESCNGFRLGPATLEVRFRGHHFGEVLALSVTDALELFADVRTIAHPLRALSEAGLAHLPLGKEIKTLSSGEAQCLELATGFAKREHGKTLYLLDDPTTGLATSDIARVIPLFHRIANHGNTLLIATHTPAIIANADYVVDLEDGTIITTGTPEDIAQEPRSQTGRFLQNVLRS